ncbi:MAG: response regulator [Akkermansiaceae bacterium]
MKLLIVDDSAMIRRAIASAYKGSTFTEVQTAADGLLAVTIFKKFLPDVVTLDITMPHMDGLAALSQMLKIHPETKVLVISALADHHTAIESLMRGAEQFICKPFTPEDLREALDDLMPDETVMKTVCKPTESSNTSYGMFGKSSSTTDSKDSPIEKSSEEAELDGATSALSPINYPSGYVAPPLIGKKEVKKSISLSAYKDEMFKK